MHRRAVLAALAGTLAATGSGCALLSDPPQTAALRRGPPAGLPPRVERTGVPFFPQTRFHCGPAALATVLADVGLPADPLVLGDQIFLPAREGTLQLEMLTGARRQGAVATRLPGSLNALLQEVAAGHAVLVLQNLGLTMAPTWHYAVLVGYDLAAPEVLLRSGTVRRLTMDLRTFERTWARSGFWAIAVLPPGRLPATALEGDAAQAVLGFARVAGPTQSALAYRSVLQRWPDNLLAAIGLANALHASDAVAEAAGVLEQAALRHDSAVAWNNLARVRLQLGHRAAAREAGVRAVQRAEQAEPAWLDAARQTLAAVTAD
jgi:hypothetical protein